MADLRTLKKHEVFLTLKRDLAMDTSIYFLYTYTYIIFIIVVMYLYYYFFRRFTLLLSSRQ